MKAIKKDYGYDIEENGEIPFRLLPCHTIHSIKLLRARIQSDGGYPAIHGFAYMPVAVVDYDEDEDGISTYWTPTSNFANVSFSKRDTAQKWIAETDMELGDFSINRDSDDKSAHISMDLRTRNFDEIYELIKTRQLTSLEFEFRFKPPKERGEYSNKDEFYKLYTKGTIDGDTYFPAQSPVYAIDSLTHPQGELENIRFTTNPIKLTQKAWSYYGGNSFGEDDSFETLLKEESKKTSKFSSLSFFEICVVSFLGLMVLLQFI